MRDADLERVPAEDDAALRPGAARGREGAQLHGVGQVLRRVALPHPPARGCSEARRPAWSRSPARRSATSASGCRPRAREKRDAVVEKVRGSYAPRIARLEERIRAAEAAVAREQAQSTQQSLQTAVSIGATILGAFLGRKTVSAATLGRATTAVRGAGRTMKEREDVGRAAENVQALAAQRDELQRALDDEIARVQAAVDPLTEQLESVEIAPKKKDVAVTMVALAWVRRTGADERGGIVRRL